MLNTILLMLLVEVIPIGIIITVSEVVAAKELQR
jgi:hypothetical protein